MAFVCVFWLFLGVFFEVVFEVVFWPLLEPFWDPFWSHFGVIWGFSGDLKTMQKPHVLRVFWLCWAPEGYPKLLFLPADVRRLPESPK